MSGKELRELRLFAALTLCVLELVGLWSGGITKG
jgi:hypothetical protein